VLVQQVAFPCWCSSCMPQTLTQIQDSVQHKLCITWSAPTLMTNGDVVRLGFCDCWSKYENTVTPCVR